ncbi:MAG: helix-turn-helix domain-containing protein [Thermodesulfobacteriota bacterium]|nr:helix-turn-helix domain-containing protein [Thermodesulfobacteriota bacterium]
MAGSLWRPSLCTAGKTISILTRFLCPGKNNPPGRGSPGKGTAGKKDTKQISLDMFNTSMTPEEIAKERGLVVSTIEGHLAYFIEQGRLDINRVVFPERQKSIEKEVAAEQDNSLRAIKDRLGEGVSYGEIRMVIAHQTSVNRTETDKE